MSLRAPATSEDIDELLRREEQALDQTWTTWIARTPAERLHRSEALRKRLPDPRRVHDAKLFPEP